MNSVKDLILNPVQRFVAGVKLKRTKYGNTENGFLACVDGNDLETFKLFLTAGVNINATDDIEETALIKATRKEHVQILSMLLEQAELQVNKQALGGDTALIAACRAGKRDAALLLLDDPRLNSNIKNDRGETALMIACQQDPTMVASLLVHLAITLNDQDRNGDTALMHASRAGNVEAVQLLLRKEGLELDLCNEQGHSALYLAIAG
ncbi:MAG TPA: ankyrin repeat domain-containing protein, partial [Anaerolineales bacterium]|nr:ankyrin repeat domain-containing protein [Anaerolineales bacterium]